MPHRRAVWVAKLPTPDYEASNTIIAPILQRVSAAPPTPVHLRFERYCGRACLAGAASRAAHQHQQGWENTGDGSLRFLADEFVRNAGHSVLLSGRCVFGVDPAFSGSKAIRIGCSREDSPPFFPSSSATATSLSSYAQRRRISIFCSRVRPSSFNICRPRRSSRFSTPTSVLRFSRVLS